MAWRSGWNDGPRRGLGFGAALGPARATMTILIACCAVTLASMIVDGRGDGTRPVIGWLALHGGNAKFVYPFFTYVLPHSTSFLLHLVLNMVMLVSLGAEIEIRFGRGRFLTLFFGGALLGAITWFAVEAASGGAGPLLGASGGIFALLFFVAREQPSRSFFFYFVAVPARVLAAILVLLDLVPLLQGASDGVAHACHLAGAAFGFVFQRHPFDALSALSGVRAAVREQSQQRTVQRARDDDAEMDRLLAKIHDSGMQSLTRSERAFLERRSKDARRRSS